MTREGVDETAEDAAKKAPPSFVYDGHERLIPPFVKLALGRTWHPALSPSSVIERCGPVALGWPVFARVLDTLKGFAGRRDLLGEWSREELKAVDAALTGKPLRLAHGNPRRKILETGTDAWLERAFDHLTGEKGLTARAAYEELARVRGVGVAAIAMKFSRLRDAADERLRDGADQVRDAAALGWSSGLEISKAMRRRKLRKRGPRPAGSGRGYDSGPDYDWMSIALVALEMLGRGDR